MSEFRNRAELQKAVQTLQEEFSERWKEQGLEAMSHKLRDLCAQMEEPGFWDEPAQAQEAAQQKAAQEKIFLPWESLKKELEEFPELIELSCQEYAQEREAILNLGKDFEDLHNRYTALLMSAALMGSDDKCNAIISITPGAGGTESQDWAEMLLRMYLRWSEERNFQVSTLDLQNGEEAGIKSASLLVRGEKAYGFLKSENGIHRLVRLSPFDSNKRRHTSFVSVHIMPEIGDEIDIELEDKDLRIDTYRASGAGGQHINKTDSAIRITHIPSKIVVQCQNERSQHKNKATAIKLLKARLYEMEKEKLEEDRKSRSGEKKIMGWGSQIRSYVMHPYKMVKDLRTGYETSKVEAVMDGALDPFIDSYLKDLINWKK